MPTTDPSRTIVDNAGILGRATMCELIEEAAVRGVLDIPRIDAILDGPRRRGARRLLRLLEPWRRYKKRLRLRSRMEAKLLPLLTEGGLPIPETNVKLAIGGDQFEVDFFWRRQKLVMETDGGPFHDTPTAAARDSKRNRAPDRRRILDPPPWLGGSARPARRRDGRAEEAAVSIALMHLAHALQLFLMPA